MTRDRVAPFTRMVAAHARADFMTYWRLRSFAVTTIAAPLVFFTFVGLPRVAMTRPDGVNLGTFFTASFSAYTVASVMVFSFGVGVAMERGMRMDTLLRATPVTPMVIILAKTLTALAFASLALLSLLAYAVVIGGVPGDAVTWLVMSARLLIGAVPFVGLGLAIGFSANAHSARAVAYLIYLPMALASGLFLPPEHLPGAVRSITPYLPTYHYGQLAWGAVGVASEQPLTSAAWLAGYAMVSFAAAVVAFRHDERTKFR
jgi:ABC-2 type transport system permease protein